MEKINKKTAKKLFESGYTIRITPNKITPNNIWGLCADVKKLECNSILGMDDIRYCNDFNFLVDNFSVYNCNYETGYYCSYYILEVN